MKIKEGSIDGFPIDSQCPNVDPGGGEPVISIVVHYDKATANTSHLEVDNVEGNR
jgi:hypothetical protein